MLRQREKKLHQAPTQEPESVPPRQRNRSCGSQPTTKLSYGVLLGTLCFFGVLGLVSPLEQYAEATSSGIRPPKNFQLLISDNNTQPSQSERTLTVEPCDTPECKHLVSEVLLPEMNSSMHPCDDFYNFACGGFVNDYKIPDGRNSYNKFSVVDDLLHEHLLAALNEEIHDDEIRAFKATKNLFQQCMNTKKIEADGIKPMLDIYEWLGGSPVLKPGDMPKMLDSFRELRWLGYNCDYLFNISVGVDPKNTSRRILYVDHATLGFSRKDLVQGKGNPNVEAYYNTMVHMIKTLGGDESKTRRLFSEVLDFEIKLANISLPSDAGLYKRLTVWQLMDKYPFYNWVDYIYEMFEFAYVQMEENEPIIVRNPSFMENLGPLFYKTSKYVVDNYIMWRVLLFSSSFLTEKLQLKQLQNKTELSAEPELELRSTKCLDLTTKRLPILVGALYSRKFFKKGSKRDVETMVNAIKLELVDILKTVDWMDEITRKVALEKMNSMVVHFDYPDDHQLQDHYHSLHYDSGMDFLNNLRNVDTFLSRSKFKKLRHPVKKTDWTTTFANPTDFSVRFSFGENSSTQIPMHNLQSPFYSNERPMYLNYGAIGSIIGREITRGFYDQGRQFDKLRDPVDWWQADPALRAQAPRFVKPSESFADPIVNQKLSGYDTLVETIADLSGVKVAYYAYQKWIGKNPTERNLAGLNLTSVQLFWLSAAQTWCTKYRPEDMGVATGSTAPEQLRVNLPISNMEEFSKDFNCAPGSPMYPTEKGKFWENALRELVFRVLKFSTM